MADPFVLKVLRVLKAHCRQPMSTVPQYWERKVPLDVPLDAAGQGGCWWPPGVVVRVADLPATPWPPSPGRSVAHLHASPPRGELLDASTKAPRLLQRFSDLFQLPRDSQKETKKQKKIPSLKFVFRRNIISLLCVCNFLLQLLVHASLTISSSFRSELRFLDSNLSLSLCVICIEECLPRLFLFSPHSLRNLFFSPRSEHFFLLCSCCCFVYLLGTLSCSFRGLIGRRCSKISIYMMLL